MSSLLIELQKACNPRMFKKFDDIVPGDYPVIEFKHIQTRYGKKLVVVTDDFMAFLPDRFLEKISDAQQLAFANTQRLLMKYHGKDTTRKNLLKLYFVEQQREDAAALTRDEWADFLVQPL